MRIRRNHVPASNNSSNDVASTSPDPLSSNPIICVLNQSPWDVADPSSPLDGGLFSLTGTSSVPELSNAPPHSVASSMKLSGDNRKRQLNRVNDDVDSDRDKERRENGARSKLSSGKIRAAKGSNSIILSSAESQIRSSISQPLVKMQQQSDSQSAPKRRGRPSKKLAAANPSEFYYYYSGFGPHWGKKRANTTSNPPPPPLKTEELSSEASPSQSVAEDARDRGIEFVDYDDEDDEEEEGRRRGGWKRVVKARSLKSLM